MHILTQILRIAIVSSRLFLPYQPLDSFISSIPGHLSKCGYNVSEIHRKTGADHKTIEKYLAKEDFSEEPPKRKVRKSILDPYKPLIHEWIEEDKNHWSKQHHTAKRIYDRLVAEEGYTGSYDTIRKYVHGIRKDRQQKATQELVWLPGFAQVDFGEADFYEENICRRRKYLVLSFPYSNDGYAQVFGGETAECVCQGLQDIFEYIGGVPEELVFDNATGVGRKIHDKVVETELFSRFRAHYGFRIRFCNPKSGWEKGNVENKVGTIRRNIFVPIPHYHDMVSYNKQLLDEHLKKAAEMHYKKGEVIAELFEEDKRHFFPCHQNASMYADMMNLSVTGMEKSVWKVNISILQNRKIMARKYG